MYKFMRGFIKKIFNAKKKSWLTKSMSCKILKFGREYFKSTACLPCSCTLLWHPLLLPILKRILAQAVVGIPILVTLGVYFAAWLICKFHLCYSCSNSTCKSEREGCKWQFFVHICPRCKSRLEGSAPENRLTTLTFLTSDLSYLTYNISDSSFIFPCLQISFQMLLLLEL